MFFNYGDGETGDRIPIGQLISSTREGSVSGEMCGQRTWYPTDLEINS